jgi:ribosomal protein S18 acetylase RimI-like enzyme
MWQELSRQHAAYDAECWDWSEDAAEKWRSHYLDMLGKEGWVVLAAADSAGKVIGFLTASLSDAAPVFAVKRNGLITNIFVKAEHRRKGIGRKLSEAAFEVMKAKGADAVRLRVAVANQGAVELYRQFGMRTVMYDMYKRV